MALHFTKQQIDEIEQALIARSKKDSQFPGADQLEGTELIPVIQNGTNKVTTYAGLLAQVSRELREYVEQALNTKVDKVEGKELSENDFTDAFKDKLEGVEAGAQVNVQSDWTALSGDAFIKNKPDLTIYATRAAVEDIEALIPIQATPTNQLADKNFVNSSIATSTAEFKGTYSTLAELETVSANVNDYGYVVTTDSAGNTVYDRYKYNGENWIFEYSLNNSSFTAAEWAAIQSGITEALVQKLETVQANAQVNVIEGVRVDGTLLPIVNKEVDIQVSGVTDDLRTEDKTDQVFFYRQTADGELNWVPSTACVEKLKGKTLVWNQLVKQEIVLGGNTHQWIGLDSGLALTANGNELQMLKSSGYGIAYYNLPSGTIVSGHIYFMAVDVKTNAPNNSIRISAYGVNTVVDAGRTFVASSNWQRLARIGKCDNATSQQFRLTDDRSSDFDTVYAKNFAFVDLTLMFGTGNEPSTVAEFEAMFPLSYYDYNAGTLLSFNGHYLKTVGFNLWDEEWEEGSYNAEGNKINYAGRIRSKNFIGVFGNVQYSFTNPNACWINEYDANKVFIRRQYISGSQATFTTDENTKYITFFCWAEGSAVPYQNNICINLSSTKNGTYEPYKETLVKTNPTELTSNGVQIFPYGLQSAGNVYDEVTETKAIKRIGRVDLGSLSWQIDWGGLNGFISCAPSEMKSVPNDLLTDFIQAKYKAANSQYTLEDKTCFHLYARFFVRDTAYTDTASFKTAMSGVYLNYELATPVVYDLDEPLDLKTVVDINGTEQVYPENTSTPYTTPIRADIQYGLKSSQLLTELRIADRLRFERDFTVTDYSGDHSGEAVGFDGSEDATIALPEVINGQVERNTEISRTEEFNYQPVPVKHFNDAYKLDKIYGKTLAWNQLVQNGNFADTSVWGVGGGTFSVANNVGSVSITITPEHNYDAYLTQGFNLISGHKYYFKAGAYCQHSGTFRLDSNSGFTGEINFPVTANNWINISVIATSQITARRNITMYPFLKTDGYAVGDVFKVRGVNLMDLTLMFGAGNEPSTVEEFEVMFPDAYYPYNAGTLISNDASAMETVGFNLFDESTLENGLWLYNGNISTEYPTRRASRKYFPCKPNTSYYKYCFDTSQYGLVIHWYDANKNYISYSEYVNRSVNSPSDAYYYRVASVYPSGALCINLSDTSFNGQYEPYRKSTLSINLDDFFVKDGQGNQVHITGGLKSAGSVYDEIVGNKYVKRIAEVNLGDLTYSNYTAEQGIFRGLVGNLNMVLDKGTVLCVRYVAVSSYNDVVANDKTMAPLSASGSYLFIHDSTFANKTPQEVKTLLSGVMLYYALATPIEYELVEPMMDSGWADENGTMRVVYEDESAPHVQFKSDITYGVNAGHIIDKANEIIKSFKEKLETLWDAVFNNS